MKSLVQRDLFTIRHKELQDSGQSLAKLHMGWKSAHVLDSHANGVLDLTKSLLVSHGFCGANTLC